MCDARRLFAALIASALLPPVADATEPGDVKNVAVIATVWYQNSHADLIAGRLLSSDTLDGKGESRRLKLVSLYVDQTPPRDRSRRFAERYGFRHCSTPDEALTLGTGSLAVDGVLLIAEHGDYPESPTGQVRYPKRRLFGEVARVFRSSGRSVPVFIDKHLSDNWEDSRWIYDTARELQIPLMAGSSIPTTWRSPALDVEDDKPLAEIVAVSYHTLDAYGFHALEAVQSLAEHRKGGETGVAAVRCLSGEEVWRAGKRGDYDSALLDAALARLTAPQAADRPLREAVPEPVLFTTEYADGLKAHVLTLNGRAGEWAAAWRYEGDPTAHACLFATQEARPFMHFTPLLKGAESMILTGRPAWPVERTLLTSGTLDALLISKSQGGSRIETPYLRFDYPPGPRWESPPPPPPDRPLDEPEP